MELVVAVDDPRAADVRALLEQHHAAMHRVTPPGLVYALALDDHDDPAVTVFSGREAGSLLGVGAIRRLDPVHAELKSMHVSVSARGRGVGHALVVELIAQAAVRGYERVSLETGTAPEFVPARRLYEKVGFVRCAPFGDYTDAPDSLCMTMLLDHRPG